MHIASPGQPPTIDHLFVPRLRGLRQQEVAHGCCGQDGRCRVHDSAIVFKARALLIQRPLGSSRWTADLLRQHTRYPYPTRGPGMSAYLAEPGILDSQGW
ncbi:hypothetical protein SUNI508_06737 [Seiridium unicorne]|uniref:Uncharacterized protein n=1 Tax=Seiridium unicorne TaxID=138068 RepID=A0ABR2V0V7_9PEZI